jgi:hypothetical protein
VNRPRIVIIELASPSQVKRWLEHCAPALGAVSKEKQDVPGHAVVWQLSSANNRALARGVRIHASVAAALADVAATRADFAQLTQRSLKISPRSEYVWVASLAGDRRLVSARVYSTVRDTRDAIAVSAQAIEAAEIAPLPRSRALAGRVA